MDSAELYSAVPHILLCCPELDDSGLLDLLREKSGRDYLDPETVQTVRALYYRERLSN